MSMLEHQDHQSYSSLPQHQNNPASPLLSAFLTHASPPCLAKPSSPLFSPLLLSFVPRPRPSSVMVRLHASTLNTFIMLFIATYYFPDGRFGACGAPSQNTDLVVALSPDQYAGGANCWRHIGVHCMFSLLSSPGMKLKFSILRRPRAVRGRDGGGSVPWVRFRQHRPVSVGV